VPSLRAHRDFLDRYPLNVEWSPGQPSDPDPDKLGRPAFGDLGDVGRYTSPEDAGRRRDAEVESDPKRHMNPRRPMTVSTPNTP